MEENKFFKVTAPEGYEIDTLNSTLDNICFKKTEQEIKTWGDLIGKDRPKTQAWVSSTDCEIVVDKVSSKILKSDRFEFIDEKHAKSAIAMAQISQLLPYFGGRITDEEWSNSGTIKYVIVKMEGKLDCAASYGEYIFLAFHTKLQRDNFLKYNERLVKDYLMLD